MSKATAGVILNPKRDDRFAFLENATMVANPDGVFMLMPDGRRIELGDPVEEMKPVFVVKSRLFFSNGGED